MLPDSWVDSTTLSLFGSADAYYSLIFVAYIPAAIFLLVFVELGFTLFVNN